MRKRIITPAQQDIASFDEDWLNIEKLAKVEITSEDATHPIEFALILDEESEWRAAGPGKQTIRLLFDNPQRLQRIRLNFEEPNIQRTQEYSLRWSPDGGHSYQEIVRQQWNFSPQGAISQVDDIDVDLQTVTILELTITPEISGGDSIASLSQLRLA